TAGTQVSSVAYSRDGHTLASGGYDSGDGGAVQLWDVADPAHPRRLGRILAGGQVAAVGFSPGGHTLASDSIDGQVQLWDVADPAHPRRLSRILTGGDSGTRSV